MRGVQLAVCAVLVALLVFAPGSALAWTPAGEDWSCGACLCICCGGVIIIIFFMKDETLLIECCDGLYVMKRCSNICDTPFFCVFFFLQSIFRVVVECGWGMNQCVVCVVCVCVCVCALDVWTAV